MKSYVLGISGASGGVYALRIARELLDLGHTLHLVASAEGERVLRYETGMDPASFAAALPDDRRALLHIHGSDDLFAPIASGSVASGGMIIAPCSMAAAAAIANGTGGDLLRRAADVHLKEKRTLVVVFREAPLSQVHLKNLLALSEAGAVILPAAPAFYGRPSSIDDIVDFVAGRALTALGIETSLAPVWSPS
jgi:4-hydroxy-3-polyprenylbenzoate decarboxylase